MTELEKAINKPMSGIMAIILEGILWIVALMFFYDSELIAGLLILIIMELRHFRHIYHINQKTE